MDFDKLFGDVEKSVSAKELQYNADSMYEIYISYVNAGFTENQSFTLLRDMIELAQVQAEFGGELDGDY